MKVNEYMNGTKFFGPEAQQAQEAQENKVNKQKSQAQQPEQKARDRVQLSGKSRDIARAQEVIKTAPETRAEKVDRIKAEVEAGTYNVKGELVANAMLKSVFDDLV